MKYLDTQSCKLKMNNQFMNRDKIPKQKTVIKRNISITSYFLNFAHIFEPLLK